MKAQGQRSVSEAMIFKTIEQQRQLVARAKAETLASRRAGPKPVKVLPSGSWGAARTPEGEAPVDYSKPAEPYDVEIW